MAISIKDLMLDKREIEVPLDLLDPDTGEDVVVNIVYKPSGMTPAVEEEASRLEYNGMRSCAVARLLSAILVEWDIEGDDSEFIPIEYEEMLVVPSYVLNVILDKVMNDLRQSKETRKNSGGGSRRKAK